MSAIYPITPSSAMGEWTDQWATEGRLNLWGRPLILLPSNPTGQSEAVPVEVIPWTGGRALVSVGSLFDSVAARAARSGWASATTLGRSSR